jgi:hypothetical protein
MIRYQRLSCRAQFKGLGSRAQFKGLGGRAQFKGLGGRAQFKGLGGRAQFKVLGGRESNGRIDLTTSSIPKLIRIDESREQWRTLCDTSSSIASDVSSDCKN